jgi:hypothetical protein
MQTNVLVGFSSHVWTPEPGSANLNTNLNFIDLNVTNCYTRPRTWTNTLINDLSIS